MCGWKHGIKLWTLRALESIRRDLHIHTHYARYSEALEAVKRAEKIGWMAPIANNNACSKK